MKRTVQVLAGLGLAGAVLLGGAASASAGTHHKDSRSAVSLPHAAERGKHHCQVAKRCRPAPLPKPPGGWPCAKDHSCSQKHHRPICKPPVTPPVKPPHHKPPKHHHRPPFVVHHHPPIVHNAPKPPVLQRVTTPDALPRTGGTSLPLAFAGGAFVLGGAALRRLARVR